MANRLHIKLRVPSSIIRSCKKHVGEVIPYRVQRYGIFPFLRIFHQIKGHFEVESYTFQCEAPI